MSKRKFSDFMRDLEDEAQAEGPEALAELEALQEHFRLAREMAVARRRKGLTQHQLAARTRIHQSEISDIERGQANPTFRTLQALASGLGHRIGLIRAVAKRATPAHVRRTTRSISSRSGR